MIGLTDEQRDLIAVLKQHTTPDARILWDETTGDRAGWNWSALLPLLTDRVVPRRAGPGLAGGALVLHDV